MWTRQLSCFESVLSCAGLPSTRPPDWLVCRSAAAPASSAEHAERAAARAAAAASSESCRERKSPTAPKAVAAMQAASAMASEAEEGLTSQPWLVHADREKLPICSASAAALLHA